MDDLTVANRRRLAKKRDAAVKERISSLLKGLETSKNAEEKTNIQGAIDAYRSGQIGYSKQYTLIWAGKVVDVADTYADFAVGRNERLDRYEKEYGPHWLWFESPLWVHPESQAKAMRCAVVDRIAAPSEFGQYYINMVGHYPASAQNVTDFFRDFGNVMDWSAGCLKQDTRLE